ncbi:MAG: hypothetical protein ACPLSA_05990, partial [Caldanaerobacter sp.]
TAWHIGILAALFIAMMGTSLVYEACFGESYWSYIAGALLPYLSTTYFLLGGLFGELMFFTVYPYFILVSIKYIKNPNKNTLFLLLLLTFLEWWLWPWGVPIILLIILNALLFIKNPKNKIFTLIIMLLILFLYFLWWYYYLTLLYDRLRIYLQPMKIYEIPLPTATKVRPLTFNELISYYNGSYLLFGFIIFSIILSFLSRTFPPTFFAMITGELMLIASPIFPFDEVSRRIFPLLIQPIWIVRIPHAFIEILRKYKL